MKSWFNITNKADATEVSIMDSIGGYGITAREFIAALKPIKGNVEVVINSPGGSVFDGLAIFNALRQMGDRVTTRVDGVAASIASIIALGGSKVRMASNSFLFIHNPSGVVMGPANEMRKMADALDKMRDSLAGIYAEKSGKPNEKAIEWMDGDTWLSAEEAIDEGLADELTPALNAAAHFDASALTMFNDDERALLAEAKHQRCFNEVLAEIVKEKNLTISKP